MTLTFRASPFDIYCDPTLDLLADGRETGIDVQDCRAYGGGFAVNQIVTDPKWVHRCYGTFRTLAKAKAKALAVYREKVAQ